MGLLSLGASGCSIQLKSITLLVAFPSPLGTPCLASISCYLQIGYCTPHTLHTLKLSKDGGARTLVILPPVWPQERVWYFVSALH
uniref:Putative secreted protein n=1 Tax=Anopheles darlingi TaxID=43151 RepID=A0A2M4DEJ6_ANODA